MHPSVRAVHDHVARIVAFDDLEAAHQADTLAWLEETDDVFRRSKPAVPERHLVSYVVLIDPFDSASLLVDHIKAGLHLPAGGHVEPDEDVVETARREAYEELGIQACFAQMPPRPVFVTLDVTGGVNGGHTDVSLWFLLKGQRDMSLWADPSEFHGIRWWTPGEIRSADSSHFDPHYERFMSKLGI